MMMIGGGTFNDDDRGRAPSMMMMIEAPLMMMIEAHSMMMIGGGHLQ